MHFSRSGGFGICVAVEQMRARAASVPVGITTRSA